MSDLFSAPRETVEDSLYPIVLTFAPDGMIEISVPNFPNIGYSGPDFHQGLELIREDLQEELLTSVFPPQPIPAAQLMLQPDQQVLMISPKV